MLLDPSELDFVNTNFPVYTYYLEKINENNKKFCEIETWMDSHVRLSILMEWVKWYSIYTTK